jgi:hypothetical protein
VSSSPRRTRFSGAILVIAPDVMSFGPGADADSLHLGDVKD